MDTREMSINALLWNIEGTMVELWFGEKKATFLARFLAFYASMPEVVS